jgi:hypothetical protein
MARTGPRRPAWGATGAAATAPAAGQVLSDVIRVGQCVTARGTWRLGWLNSFLTATAGGVLMGDMSATRCVTCCYAWWIGKLHRSCCRRGRRWLPDISWRHIQGRVVFRCPWHRMVGQRGLGPSTKRVRYSVRRRWQLGLKLRRYGLLSMWVQGWQAEAEWLRQMLSMLSRVGQARTATEHKWIGSSGK